VQYQIIKDKLLIYFKVIINQTIIYVNKIKKKNDKFSFNQLKIYVKVALMTIQPIKWSKTNGWFIKKKKQDKLNYKGK